MRLASLSQGKRAVVDRTQAAVFHVAQNLPQVFAGAAAAANERQMVEVQVAEVQLGQHVARDAADDQYAAARRQGADALAHGAPAAIVHDEIDAASAGVLADLPPGVAFAIVEHRLSPKILYLPHF